MTLKFSGLPDGTKPSTQARRYVWHALFVTLQNDIENADYINIDLAEADVRLARKAAQDILKQLKKKVDGR